MTKKLLHIVNHGVSLPNELKKSGLEEVRLTPTPEAEGDIKGTIRNIDQLPESSFKAIWCPMALSHLHPWELHDILAGCLRALEANGVLSILLHDLQRLGEIAYKSPAINRPIITTPAGPVTMQDMLFGYHKHVKENRPMSQMHMAFTANSLAEELEKAGFLKINIKRDKYYLRALARKVSAPEGTKARVQIEQEDINKVITERDKMDGEPNLWNNEIEAEVKAFLEKEPEEDTTSKAAKKPGKKSASSKGKASPKPATKKKPAAKKSTSKNKTK